MATESNNKLLRYAAIDIGSNAVRLLLCNVVEEHGVFHFKKSELIRIPLRLGEDVFKGGRILARKSDRFLKTMHAFKLLIDVFEPVSYRACATASMREAINGEELVMRIRRECGLRIEIISGKKEAELIYSNHIEQNLDPGKSYLYIDVGGGSTEITLFDKGKIIDSRSFNIGTIRWLQGKVSREQWEFMKSWVKETMDGHVPHSAIGSGGNINKIFKIFGRKDKPLTFLTLKNFYDDIKLLSLDDRMEKWGLNPDRADVILPATKIFLSIMKAAKTSNIYVPQIGLADGIIHQLHERYLESSVA
jgi:exopolyphosphatase / guanosine-5'-triphosphate,3'-diphosphate pyrophosphatase